MTRYGWFKFYTEALDDTKLARLTDSQWRCWWSLVALARDSATPGVIHMSVSDLAWRLRNSEEWVLDGLKACERTGLVALKSDAVHVVQFVARQAVGRNPEPREAVTERKRAQRERDRRDSVVTVTPSRTPREEESTTWDAGECDTPRVANKARVYKLGKSPASSKRGASR